MFKKYIAATLLAASAFTCAQAETITFEDIASDMGRIEQASSGDIWLMPPLSNLALRTRQGCTYNQVKLDPPAGKESAWLSMVMMALSTNKSITVLGYCDEVSKIIVANRLVINFAH